MEVLQSRSKGMKQSEKAFGLWSEWHCTTQGLVHGYKITGPSGSRIIFLVIVLQWHSDHMPMSSRHMKGRLLLLMNCHFLSWYIFFRKFHLFSSSFQTVQYVSADDSTKNKLIVTFYVLLPFISTSYLTITQYVLTIDALQGKSFTVILQ